MASQNYAVLLLEHDLPTRALYERALSDIVTVIACADAVAALAILHSIEVAAVIVEPNLPGDPGGAIVQSLRTASGKRALPLIVCSTIDPQQSTIALAATDVYLVKPVRPGKLAQVLTEVLQLT
jgi:DNA-binding response OmpR family regulator